MKTRQEITYDLIIAMASSYEYQVDQTYAFREKEKLPIANSNVEDGVMEHIYLTASAFAKYIEEEFENENI